MKWPHCFFAPFQPSQWSRNDHFTPASSSTYSMNLQATTTGVSGCSTTLGVCLGLELTQLAASATNTGSSLSAAKPALQLQGESFNVNAMKSTFKMTTTDSNMYQVWLNEMADVELTMVEDLTKGLVCNPSICRYCFSLIPAL